MTRIENMWALRERLKRILSPLVRDEDIMLDDEEFVHRVYRRFILTNFATGVLGREPTQGVLEEIEAYRNQLETKIQPDGDLGKGDPEKAGQKS